MFHQYSDNVLMPQQYPILGAICLPSSFINTISGYNSQSHKFDLQNSLIAAVQCFSVIFSTNSSLTLSLSWLASITVW